jgi:hypothetical protein
MRLAAGAVAISLLSFSSCTCSSQAPEPPKVAERSGGFGAIVTPRKLPDRSEGKVAPREVPTPEEKGVPTEAPKLPQTTLPDNFPEDVPIPDGSEVMAVQRLANDARNVVFATEGESPELFKLYKDKMEEQWGTPTQQAEGQDQSFLSFQKNSTIINISISKDPRTGRRVVAVMYYEEKPLPFPEF